MSVARVLSTAPLESKDAKWIALKKINWSDQDGRQRVWECAERKTRGTAGVDAVAIFAILRSKTNAFPLSTVIIEQYRPPIDRIIVELPAGLVDEDETAEDAAIRELEEETGYKAEKVVESSPIIVCDPGMSNANMKNVVVSVLMEDKMETPDSKPAEGEHIVKRVVELSNLSSELQKYEAKGFSVDARLWNFAQGYELAERIKSGAFP
ncbi:NUDIX hydrolase domain-like protein [Phlebopus sp. FC_14]|nr:NUDIX hydrolase domain-like protein [Phlebopus sp. FC_14]